EDVHSLDSGAPIISTVIGSSRPFPYRKIIVLFEGEHCPENRGLPGLIRADERNDIPRHVNRDWLLETTITLNLNIYQAHRESSTYFPVCSALASMFIAETGTMLKRVGAGL